MVTVGEILGFGVVALPGHYIELSETDVAGAMADIQGALTGLTRKANQLV